MSFPASSQKKASFGEVSVMTHTNADDRQSQSDKFKEAARERGADEDEAHWDERLKKVVKKPPIKSVD